MLDLRVTSGTPGSVLVTANLATLPAGDGQVVAGVPLNPSATLVIWGSISIIANTIAATKLLAQDLVDPINGITVSMGSTSLQNLFYKFETLPYSTGARVISQGTNTAQSATSLGITVDWYDPGKKVGDCVGGDGKDWRFVPDQEMVPQTLATDIAVSWTTTGFAPAVQIPNGKYALLGAYLGKSTEAHCIRFIHADFGFCAPGFPMVDSFASAILGFQKGMKDNLATDPGYQFVLLSELLRKPAIPVFNVTPAGTGLNIQSIAPSATDTPVITTVLAKIG